MANPRDRRLARERALQVLFGADFTGYDAEETLESFWGHTPAAEEVKSYAEKLVHAVHEHKADLDAHINAALTDWSPERVGRVERSLLRLAVCELLHMEGVPTAVVINEAIEIAKKYGDEEAVPFVHAVLDRIAKQAQNDAKQP